MAPATCSVHLIHAGSLSLPRSILLLPGPNVHQPNFPDIQAWSKGAVPLPIYAFLITHHPTGDRYLVDLGVRENPRETLPPPFVKSFDQLSQGDEILRDPLAILRSPANSTGVKPEDIKALIMTHLHVDHVGNLGAVPPGTEFWMGPTSCLAGRPGYPGDEMSNIWAEELPTDGSRKIVEYTIPEEEFARSGDSRAGEVQKGEDQGKYAAVERRVPRQGWRPVGPFERAADLFEDGSLLLVDAPGHMPGHALLYVRVKDDDYILLTGDAFHHPDILKEPGLLARPPYSWEGKSMHADGETAKSTIEKINKWAHQDNVWIVASHDPSIENAILKHTGEKEIEGLVCLDEWRSKNWKQQQV